MILALLSLTLAATCPLEGASSVVGSRVGHVTVTTPKGSTEYNAKELQAVAAACGYSETAAAAAAWSKSATRGWVTCSVGLCLFWPVGIAAPFYWVAAREQRDALGPVLLREAEGD
jgi:hypothetical protein